MRNVLQPVNRLPPEILSSIARYCLDEDARDARSIVPLTHVCQYWRWSIASAPENWTLISSSKAELAALSLERAKAARLDVTLNLPQLTPGIGAFSLTTHTQNIDTLTVYNIPSAQELIEALPNFPRSTPNLRSLTLHRAYANARWESADPFESIPPTLKCLSLFNIPLYPSLSNLRALTDITLRYHRFDLYLDTLLAFLENNRSLKNATLDIRFTEPAFRISRRRTVVINRLQHLSISCNNPVNAQALLSNIALQKGAHLKISSLDQATGLNDILSDIPTTHHLSNLPSPTFMEYESYPRDIRLLGPNGSFSFACLPSLATPFAEFPLFSFSNIREFRLKHRAPERLRSSLSPTLVFQSQSFPALEALSIDSDADLSTFLSTLLSNPSSSPSLRTLGFLNCVVTGYFMEKLTTFSSNRKKTTAAWLHRVAIVDKDGGFPNAASIRELGRHVSVVDVWFGTKLPADLA